MYRHLATLVLLGAAAAWPQEAQAQDWRTLTSRRQYAGEDRLHVDLDFGAGRLRVEPAAAGALYTAQIRYDADVFKPVTTYRDGKLKLGLEGGGRIRRGLKDGGRMELGLGPDAVLDLSLAFGAAEAELELGGLKIRRARIATGASETRVRFSRPNPERLELLELELGAASFSATGLGNANAERLKLSGGVGDFTLDFSGAWSGDTRAELSMGIGSLTLRIPEGVGVQVQRSTFLMSFDSQGLVKRGNAFYSENWDQARRRLTIDVDGALGSINVHWLRGTEADH